MFQLTTNPTQTSNLTSYLTRTSDFSPLIDASQQAAAIKSNAATAAGQLGVAGLQTGQNQLQQGNVNSLSYTNPYINQGAASLQQAADLMGLSGKSYQDIMSQVVKSPAYQFNLQEILNAMDKSASSRGKLYSGQTIKAEQDRASQLASNEYNRILQNSLDLAKYGGQFAANQGNQEFNLGNILGQYSTDIGNVQGNATLAAANAQAQGLLDAASGRVAQSTALGLNSGQALSPGMFGSNSSEVYYGGSDAAARDQAQANSEADYQARMARNQAAMTGGTYTGTGGGGGFSDPSENKFTNGTSSSYSSGTDSSIPDTYAGDLPTGYSAEQGLAAAAGSLGNLQGNLIPSGDFGNATSSSGFGSDLTAQAAPPSYEVGSLITLPNGTTDTIRKVTYTPVIRGSRRYENGGYWTTHGGFTPF